MFAVGPKNTARLASLAGKTNPERRRQAENEKNKGNEFYLAGEIKNAIECYTLGLSVVPETQADLAVKLHSNRAAAYIKSEMWDDALVDCEAALACDETHQKSRVRRAKARVESKMYEGALADAECILSQVLPLPPPPFTCHCSSLFCSHIAPRP